MITNSFFTKFYLYFGFIAPVSILFIVNLLIIYKATQYSRLHKASTVVSTGTNLLHHVELDRS